MVHVFWVCSSIVSYIILCHGQTLHNTSPAQLHLHKFLMSGLLLTFFICERTACLCMCSPFLHCVEIIPQLSNLDKQTTEKSPGFSTQLLAVIDYMLTFPLLPLFKQLSNTYALNSQVWCIVKNLESYKYIHQRNKVCFCNLLCALLSILLPTLSPLPSFFLLSLSYALPPFTPLLSLPFLSPIPDSYSYALHSISSLSSSSFPPFFS